MSSPVTDELGGEEEICWPGSFVSSYVTPRRPFNRKTAAKGGTEFSAGAFEHQACIGMETSRASRSRESRVTGDLLGVSWPTPVPVVKQRCQANARERDRTYSVNSAFSTLRTLIPTEPADRKLSKIETLRLASSYISHLGTQLLAGPVDSPCLRESNTYQTDIISQRPQICTFCLANQKRKEVSGGTGEPPNTAASALEQMLVQPGPLNYEGALPWELTLQPLGSLPDGK